MSTTLAIMAGPNIGGHTKPTHEDAGERELLHHAAGELPGAARLEACDAGALQQIANMRRCASAGRACRHQQILIETEALGHVGDSAAHRELVIPGVEGDGV